VFCVAHIHAQAISEPRPYTPAAKTVDESINQWERKSDVKVDGDARAEIRSDVDRINYSKIFLPKERLEEAKLWATDVLIKAYLYAIWARDRARTMIEKGAVVALRISDYVATLTVLGDPFGNLFVESTPVGASISRDGKNLGLTKTSFLVSKEAHDYRILSAGSRLDCKKTIQVEPGTSQTMGCPEGTIK